MTSKVFARALVAIAGLSISATLYAEDRVYAEPAEQKLFDVLDAVERGADDTAYQLAESLTAEYPNFQLAQLIYGDLLAAQGMGSVLFSDSRKSAIDRLRDEAQARLSHQHSPNEHSLVARNLIKLSSEYRNVLVFELAKSRLYLFENNNGTPRLIKDYYMSIGKAGIDKQVEGDNKTPVGVYRITSYLPDEKLPELYGVGAYPIDYPNSWDRLHGKTGYGIWLHGVPRATYSRPPLDSEGCMVVSNVNLEQIGPYIDLRTTPVVLTKHVEWVDSSETAQLRTALEDSFRQWQSDWMSMDVDAYLRHYSADFQTGKDNFASWGEHKRRVAAGKSFIDVKIANADMFVYPETSAEESLVVVSFVQDYNSNNFSSVSRKQQFWKKEADGNWRIIYEGA